MRDFSLETWRTLLRETGFEVYQTVFTGESVPTFVCVKALQGLDDLRSHQDPESPA